MANLLIPRSCYTFFYFSLFPWITANTKFNNKSGKYSEKWFWNIYWWPGFHGWYFSVFKSKNNREKYQVFSEKCFFCFSTRKERFFWDFGWCNIFQKPYSSISTGFLLSLWTSGHERWTFLHQMSTSRAQINTLEQLISTSEPQMNTSEPQINTSEQLISTSEPQINTSEQLISTSEPQMSTSEAIISTSEVPPAVFIGVAKGQKKGARCGASFSWF